MDEDYFGSSSPEFQDLADALLIVEDKPLPVHKAVLAAKSPTFARLFTSCSTRPDKPDAKFEVHLDDSLHTVCTTLKYIYQGCTRFSATELQSVEDAYHVTSFAHKYDMLELLHKCEAYLLGQAETPSNIFSKPGDAVKWTLLAEKCMMSTLLARCELFMAEKSNGAFWSDPEEKTMQLSGESMLRMLKVGAWHRRNGEGPAPLKRLIQWQQGTNRVKRKRLIQWQQGINRAKRKAEDDLQGGGSLTLEVQHLRYEPISMINFGRHMELSQVFAAYKQRALQRGWLSSAAMGSVKFMESDGEILNGTETAADLDFNPGTVIHVEW